MLDQLDLVLFEHQRLRLTAVTISVVKFLGGLFGDHVGHVGDLVVRRSGYIRGQDLFAGGKIGVGDHNLARQLFLLILLRLFHF